MTLETGYSTGAGGAGAVVGLAGGSRAVAYRKYRNAPDLAAIRPGRDCVVLIRRVLQLVRVSATAGSAEPKSGTGGKPLKTGFFPARHE